MKAYAVLCAAILVAGSAEVRAQTQDFPIDGGNSTVACRVDGNIQRTGRPFGSAPTTVTGCTLAADAPYLLPGPGISVNCKGGGLIQFHPEIARLKSCVVGLDANLRDTNNAAVVCPAGFTAEFNERGYLLSCRSAAVASGGSSGGGLFGPIAPPPPPVDAGRPGGGGLFGPVSSQPPTATGGVQDWSTVCRSAMTAILRGHQASFGPQASVRVEWARPFTYDNDDCVGGFRVWVRRPGDVSEWIALDWNASTGMGRVAAEALVQQYQKDNPDLPWGPSSGGPVPTATTGTAATADRNAICRSAMVAMEREKQAQWGSDGRVRYEWVRPFTYDNGDCVGGYKIWVKRPSDRDELTTLEWFADLGNGRVPVAQLVNQYQQKYPDLQWTPR